MVVVVHRQVGDTEEEVNRGDVALPMLVVVVGVVVVWMCVEKFCLVAHVPKHQLWKLTRS